MLSFIANDDLSFFNQIVGISNPSQAEEPVSLAKRNGYLAMLSQIDQKEYPFLSVALRLRDTPLYYLDSNPCLQFLDAINQLSTQNIYQLIQSDWGFILTLTRELRSNYVARSLKEKWKNTIRVFMEKMVQGLFEIEGSRYELYFNELFRTIVDSVRSVGGNKWSCSVCDRGKLTLRYTGQAGGAPALHSICEVLSNCGFSLSIETVRNWVTWRSNSFFVIPSLSRNLKFLFECVGALSVSNTRSTRGDQYTKTGNGKGKEKASSKKRKLERLGYARHPGRKRKADRTSKQPKVRFSQAFPLLMNDALAKEMAYRTPIDPLRSDWIHRNHDNSQPYTVSLDLNSPNTGLLSSEKAISGLLGDVDSISPFKKQVEEQLRDPSRVIEYSACPIEQACGDDETARYLNTLREYSELGECQRRDGTLFYCALEVGKVANLSPNIVYLIKTLDAYPDTLRKKMINGGFQRKLLALASVQCAAYTQRLNDDFENTLAELSAFFKQEGLYDRWLLNEVSDFNPIWFLYFVSLLPLSSAIAEPNQACYQEFIDSLFSHTMNSEQSISENHPVFEGLAKRQKPIFALLQALKNNLKTKVSSVDADRTTAFSRIFYEICFEELCKVSLRSKTLEEPKWVQWWLTTYSGIITRMSALCPKAYTDFNDLDGDSVSTQIRMTYIQQSVAIPPSARLVVMELLSMISSIFGTPLNELTGSAEASPLVETDDFTVVGSDVQNQNMEIQQNDEATLAGASDDAELQRRPQSDLVQSNQPQLQATARPIQTGRAKLDKRQGLEDHWAQRNQVLQIQNQALQKQNQALQKKAIESNVQWKQRVPVLQTQNQALQKQAKESNAQWKQRVQVLETQNQTLKKQAIESNAQWKPRVQALQTQNRAFEVLNRGLKKNKKKNKERFKKTLSDKNKEIERLNCNNKQLERNVEQHALLPIQLSKEKEQNAMLRHRLKRKDRAIGTLEQRSKQQLNKKTKLLNEGARRYSKMSQELERVKRENHQVKNQYSVLKVDSRQQREEDQQLIKTLQDKNARSQGRNKVLEHSMQGATDQINSLQNVVRHTESVRRVSAQFTLKPPRSPSVAGNSFGTNGKQKSNSTSFFGGGCSSGSKKNPGFDFGATSSSLTQAPSAGSAMGATCSVSSIVTARQFFGARLGGSGHRNSALSRVKTGTAQTGSSSFSFCRRK